MLLVQTGGRSSLIPTPPVAPVDPDGRLLSPSTLDEIGSHLSSIEVDVTSTVVYVSPLGIFEGRVMTVRTLPQSLVC